MSEGTDDVAAVVRLVIGNFPSEWRPETRALVESALSGTPGAAELLLRFEREPWGAARDQVVAALLERCSTDPDVRATFDAAAARERLLAESLELAIEVEAALRIPSAEIQRDVGRAVDEAVGRFPKVQRLLMTYRANSDLGLVVGQFQRALGAVLAVDPAHRSALRETVATAAGLSVVHRWQDGRGPEWLPDYLRFAFREHPVVLEGFERLAARPGSRIAVSDFLAVVTPAALRDPQMRRFLLIPEVGGMGPGLGIDLAVLEPEETAAPPPEEPPAGSVSGGDAAPLPAVPPLVPAPPGDDREAPASHRAHPVLRPQGLPAGESLAVHAGLRFLLEVGIGPAPDPGLAAPRDGVGSVAAGMLVEVELVFDPASFRIESPGPIALRVTPEERYPTAAVDVEVLPLDDPDIENRRIAAHFSVDGELRAVVFRTFREAGRAGSPEPPTSSMIDLRPLREADPPGVVLAIYGADSSAPGRHMLAVFPKSAEIAPPEVVRIELDSSADAVMTQMYELASSDEGSTTKRLTDLLGKAAAIGDALPDPVLATLREVAAAARDAPPRMLLLTEETRLPWELAALAPGRALSSAHGGDSPFLGAHFAIGRWPLSAARREQPVPRREPVLVRSAALVSAQYDGAEGWDPLDGAIAEVHELEQSYAPAVIWPPLLDEVLDRLSDEVDVVHFALHGQFAAGDADEGLVLLKQGDARLEPTYLGADTIRGRSLQSPPLFPAQPFVFLNACQVGQHRRVLGDYAGLAVAMLRAGASGVVACIWNVDDGVASSISREFYRRADAGEAPAEILRSMRARWSPTGDEAASAPTLLAYQYFGHPSMQVQRSR